MLISIFASIGSQNLGDELILKNEIKILEKKYGTQTQFIVFSYDYKQPFFQKENIVYKEYFPICIRDSKNIWKNIKNFFYFLYITLKSDLIIIGGGGIIYDNEKSEKINSLGIWLFRTRIFGILRKKVHFFRVGIDIRNNDNLKYVKKIFAVGDFITLRDMYSCNTLKQLGIKALMKKDPVFYDTHTPPKKNFLIKAVVSYQFSYKDLVPIDWNQKTVGIAMRKGYLSNHQSNIAAQMEEGKINEIINFILQSGGNIVFLPHSFHKGDPSSNDFIFMNQFIRTELLDKYPQKISITQSMEDTYRYYKNQTIDICIAQRLHSMILSHIYQIPFFALNYGRKTDEVLQNFDMYIK